jgi:hypothetical protein
VAVFAFVSVMTTVIVTVGIWPGEAKLLAPVLCPDDQPDAFVVADTTSVRPGETSTNFTLYCMGDQGQHTDQGFGIPFLLLTVAHAALWAAVIVLFGLSAAIRRRGRRGPSPTGTEPGDDEAPSLAGDPPSGPIITG